MNLRFGDEDWARIARDYTAWWNHALDRPLVQIMGWEPEPGREYPELPRRVAGFGDEMSPEEMVDRVTPHLEATRYYGDAFPRWWVDFGPGMMAGFLGAEVHVVPETVWFSPSAESTIWDLHPTYDPDNFWWQRIQAVTRVAVEAWGKRVQVGHTDLGGNLDVLASLRTTEGLLLDLYDAPEEVDRLVAEITALWLRYYDELDALIRPTCRGTVPWAPIWSPETSYMLQCDFAYMISPQMFERFVLPDLTACCEHLAHGFYHLDGPAQIQHVDMLLAIERLRGIQWVPGAGNPEPEGWPDLLRRIVGAGRLCQLHVSAAGALEIVRQVGGKGFMFTVGDRMTADEAEEYLALLAREDRGAARR